MTLRNLLLGLGAVVLTVVLIALGALETVELGTLNRLFEWRGPRRPVAPIVIVAIDEDSFDELNVPWPFPRAMHGKLLDAIAAGRPLVIGVDLLFPEPSAFGPSDDTALGAAVARAGNVVLGAARTEVSEGFYHKSDLNMPLPVIRRGAAAVAPVNLFQDVDAQVRRAPLGIRLGDETFPAFDVALHRLAAAAGLPVHPLPVAPEIWINFRGGPRTFPWIPYHRVVNGDVPPETFAGTIVLVGPTSEVLHDVFPTPFARRGNMPGVEIHANALNTLVQANRIRPVPWSVSLGLAVVAALGATWLAARLRVLRAFLAVAVLWVALAAGTLAALTLGEVWFRSVGVMVGLVLGYGITVIDNFVREQRERRRLAQFFSPAVLGEIVRHRAGVTLGSSRRTLTVLFSDIRGFTSISERVEPEQVAEMLSEYLTEMTEVVFRHGGTVDKYIGDCIMALYNVPLEDPDHAANAVRTGLEFQERTLAVSARWEARLGVQIKNGVGINTGDAVVGTMGSRQRLEYTAIGDTENLASRLEALTKDYGAGIIISEFTHERVKDQFLTRVLDEVAVKGKTRPVKIYAVLPGDIRKYPRATLEAAATVVAVGSGQACAVRTRDVSEGGLSLVGLPPEWPLGSRVEIRCEGGALPGPLLVEGTIAWRRDDRAGVAFAVVAPDAAPALVDDGRERRP
ncbi:MAG: CHASE2 domain-containing protein [Candidatus Rokubacteria bacterium]|nr:CHASE2 domain-containing protein [Candidatus Rokubacteria bacterium]